jgi:hypothetical protein
MGLYCARLLPPGFLFQYRATVGAVMVAQTISPSFFEGMHMNKVLVAGILGLMLTACGQKEEKAAAPAAAPAAEVAATVEKAASEATSTVEKATSEATATVEKAATEAATKVEAAVSDAKAN